VATAITILEVRAGLRAPQQLERLSHYSLWRAWPRLAQPVGQNRALMVPRPRAVTVRELIPGLVDATVVVAFGGYAHALALRLDGAPGFWQLVELDYPTERAAPALQSPAEQLPAPSRLEGDAPPVRNPGQTWHRGLSSDSSHRTLRPDLTREPAPCDSPGIELE
jgi:hypothetical protein